MDTLPSAMPDPKVLTRSLQAIADLNAEFLEALVETAKYRPDLFPLPRALRSDFSQILVTQRRERGRCGILLADARFSDSARWAGVVSGNDPDVILEEQEQEHWLSVGQGVVVAHSVLMVAWHVVHAVPSLVSVLLGMSDGVAREFGKLSISDLTHIARHRASWVRPRWAGREDLWASIITRGHSSLDQEPPVVLRCLQATASESHRMLSSMASGGA
jgi:hypothetical protein